MGSKTKETISGPPHGKPLIAHFLSNWLKPAVGAAICWTVLGATVACAAEGSSFTFRKPALTVPELGQRVMLEVVRSGNLAASASVEVVTLPGSATPSEDYLPSQITLHFKPEQTNQFALVQIIADPAQEAQETFTAALTNASSDATIDAPAQATITINDSPHVTLSSIDETSMRAALAQGGVIHLNTDFILRVTNALEVTKDTAIQTTNVLATIEGARLSRVFHVHEGVTLVLKGLAIRDGASDAGAGLYNAGGFVTLADCQFLGNNSGGANATEAVATLGGAILNSGQLVITNCVFTTNTAQGFVGVDDAESVSKTGGVAQGGAVYSVGELWVEDSAFSGNSARGGNGGHSSARSYPSGGNAGTALGGAIFSTNRAWIFRTTFTANSTIGGVGGDARGQEVLSHGGGGGNAEGGALFSAGRMYLAECSFEGSAAMGGNSGMGRSGGPGGTAQGGAVLNQGNLKVVSNCSFRSNQVVGGWGRAFKFPAGGGAHGGGICNSATVNIDSALLLGNEAGLAGGAIYNSGSLLQASASRFISNSVTGGQPYGGAVMNYTTAEFTNCAFRSNHARGVAGTSGFGGALANRGGLSLSACSLTLNSARASEAGYIPTQAGFIASRGSDAAGGGIWSNGGVVNLLNTTVSSNYAFGGVGGSLPTGTSSSGRPGGEGGSAFGAGLYAIHAFVNITYCTILGNSCDEGVGGLGSGSYADQRSNSGSSRGDGVCIENTDLSLLNTIIAANLHENVWGNFTGDHNLITNQFFGLGYAATNALGTEYYPLMPDSPAIDAARPLPNAQTDQSGVSRPFGSAPDIGAIEWNGTTFYPYVQLRRFEGGLNHPVLRGVGPPGTTAKLQISNDLTNWSDSVTVEITTNGLFEVSPVPLPGQGQGFYRLLAVEK